MKRCTNHSQIIKTNHAMLSSHYPFFLYSESMVFLFRTYISNDTVFTQRSPMKVHYQIRIKLKINNQFKFQISIHCEFPFYICVNVTVVELQAPINYVSMFYGQLGLIVRKSTFVMFEIDKIVVL